MTLVLRDPWRMMEAWRNELNRTKQHLGPLDDSKIGGGEWTPAVDIREEDGRYLLYADIPGVKPEEIEVSMEREELTIKGERRYQEMGIEGNQQRIERPCGVFYRRFSLPDDSDAEKISATGKDGVLKVVIPKTEARKKRRIEIRH